MSLNLSKLQTLIPSQAEILRNGESPQAGTVACARSISDLRKSSLPSRRQENNLFKALERHITIIIIFEKQCAPQCLTDTYKLPSTRLPAQPKLDIACSNYLDQMQFICFIFVFLCSLVTYKCHCSVYLL